jgi:hypothetical protein
MSTAMSDAWIPRTDPTRTTQQRPSVTRIHLGSAGRMRTPMACYASTFRRPPTCPAIPVTTSTSSPPNSIAVHERDCPGAPPPRRSTSYCPIHPVLL